MKKSLFALTVCAVALAAASANAAVLITGNIVGQGEATPAKPGFSTYVLTATSDSGPIIGFNFAGTGGSGLGINGPMNQTNPFGANTIWNDTPAAQFTAAGQDIKQDSHFTVLANGNLTVGGEENANTLQGAWNTLNVGAATNVLQFAQIVIADGSPTPLINAVGDFTVATPSGDVLQRATFQVAVPEPATCLLAGMGLVGVALAVRRRK